MYEEENSKPSKIEAAEIFPVPVNIKNWLDIQTNKQGLDMSCDFIFVYIYI